MPVNALRSVRDEIDRVLRAVHVNQLVNQLARTDKALFYKYFKGYRADKIGRGRIRKIIEREVLDDSKEGHELLANLVIIHWNDKHAKLYNAMVAHVQAINEDVEAIDIIEDRAAHDIIDDLLNRFDRRDILACVRLNGVRFRDHVSDARLARGEDRPSDDEIAAAEAAAIAEAELDDDAGDDDAGAAAEAAAASPGEAAASEQE